MYGRCAMEPVYGQAQAGLFGWQAEPGWAGASRAQGGQSAASTVPGTAVPEVYDQTESESAMSAPEGHCTDSPPPGYRKRLVRGPTCG